MNEPIPPKREPHYIWNEDHQWPLDVCASGLIDTLCGFVSPPIEFRGDASGHIWKAQQDKTTARLAFTSNKGDGHIQLTVDASAWVRAEVYISGELKFRAWVEEPWEEKEFWADGADGVTPPNEDPPGRISKRGLWLQLKCAAFPGVPDKGNGYWDVEDVTINS